MTEAPAVFCFGSNLAGRHGKGAAKWALENRGAIYGQGWGLQGNSFAIPTKDENLEILSLDIIGRYIRKFIIFAEAAPGLSFEMTPIGCGLAGYHPLEIAPLFVRIPANVAMPREFTAVVGG